MVASPVRDDISVENEQPANGPVPEGRNDQPNELAE